MEKIETQIEAGSNPKVAAIMREIVPSDQETPKDADELLETFRKKQEDNLKLLQGIETSQRPENLVEMLAVADMSRDDIYITNIVKYRPPGNRDPLPEEKKAFWPYLLKQIEIIQPQIVVTLGRHSMEYFLPGQLISKIHGEPQRIRIDDNTLAIVPLYHPAAALYNGSLRQTLIDDFIRMPTIIDELKK